jgi:hypothetical protein
MGLLVGTVPLFPLEEQAVSIKVTIRTEIIIQAILFNGLPPLLLIRHILLLGHNLRIMCNLAAICATPINSILKICYGFAESLVSIFFRENSYQTASFFPDCSFVKESKDCFVTGLLLMKYDMVKLV